MTMTTKVNALKTSSYINRCHHRHCMVVVSSKSRTSYPHPSKSLKLLTKGKEAKRWPQLKSGPPHNNRNRDRRLKPLKSNQSSSRRYQSNTTNQCLFTTISTLPILAKPAAIPSSHIQATITIPPISPSRDCSNRQTIYTLKNLSNISSISISISSKGA